MPEAARLTVYSSALPQFAWDFCGDPWILSPRKAEPFGTAAPVVVGCATLTDSHGDRDAKVKSSVVDGSDNVVAQ